MQPVAEGQNGVALCYNWSRLKAKCSFLTEINACQRPLKSNVIKGQDSFRRRFQNPRGIYKRLNTRMGNMLRYIYLNRHLWKYATKRRKYTQVPSMNENIDFQSFRRHYSLSQAQGFISLPRAKTGLSRAITALSSMAVVEMLIRRKDT